MIKRIAEFFVGVVLVLSGLYWLGGGVPMRAGVVVSNFPLTEIVNHLAALLEILIGLLVIGYAMGNVKAVIRGMVTVIIIALLLFYISVAVAAEKRFSITEKRPNMLIVVANESDHLGGSAALSGVWPFEGYGESLSEALQYIGERYTIKTITPIVYAQHPGSYFGSAVTKMLIVTVEPHATPDMPKPKK